MVISQQNARQNMLDSQLATSSVHDARVLAALDLVPRENFVPESYKKTAYFDEEIRVDEESVMLSPLVFARMLQVAELQPTDFVLDIACGTGYSSSVISYLCKKVMAVESSTKLVGQARSNIEKLGISNINFVRNDHAKGCAANTKYDKIFINGQVEFISEAILDQLKPDGKVITVMRVEEHGILPFIVTFSLDKKHVLSLKTHFQAQSTMLAEFTNKKTFKF
jgi:protein-L-isoaspartate(D-aspartate) O-methyltransferase